MQRTNVPDHLGPVARQLLEQRYREAPRERQSKGESEALGVARQWLEEIFTEPFWPDQSVCYFVHEGDATSCDAVQHQYSIKADSGEFEISVIQTVFIILVTVTGEPVAGRDRDVARVATELGQRLFRHKERLNFTVTDRDANGVFGCQVSEVASSDYDWLDTILWWSDGNSVGFEMLKRTGAGEAAIVSSILEANRTWFASFERPRTR